MNDIDAYFNNPLGETRIIPESMAISAWARQGDVYLTRIENFDRTGFEKTANRQIAEGSTKGSRHTVDETVTVWKNKTENKTPAHNGVGFLSLGPVIESKDRFHLSHPEHADLSFPGGCYQVSFQTDGQTMARVLD